MIILSSYYLILLVLILFSIFFIKWKQNYWKNYGICQYITIFFFGSIIDVITNKKTFNTIIMEGYKFYKSAAEKHFGIYLFLKPIYIPIDLTVIKNMLTRDFSHFGAHGFFYHHPKDALSINLFSMEGKAWKELREKLTPAFTSGKIKMMFNIMLEKSKVLERITTDSCKNGPLNISDLCSRFTTDVIGMCTYSVNCNSLEESDNEFIYYGNKASSRPVWKFWLMLLLPWSFLGNLGLKSATKDVENFFRKLIKDAINYRKKKNLICKDFVELLLKVAYKESLTEENMIDYEQKTPSLTDDEITSQSMLFFLGGFETSAIAISFALFELAQNEHMQDKVRENIIQVLDRYDGKVTYDAIMEMDFLDRVVNETLRKYPPGTIVPRICTKTYNVPQTDAIIPKGAEIYIPVWAIHNDPEYYPNPEVFDPERFNKENIKKRPDFTFLPFGEGPRMCIGLRFGILQVKVGLVSLIRNLKFITNKKTQLPLKYDSKKFVLVVEGGIWLNVNKI